MTRRHQIDAFYIALYTLLIYIFTMSPGTKPYTYYLFILFAAAGFVLYLLGNRNRTVYIYIIMGIILLWVGSTGWFFSPFFYMLYLLGVALSFLYSSIVSIAFVGVLILLFLPNIGSIDVVLDSMALFSLFSIIPLTYFLRREYLHLKQNEKKILVLEKDQKMYANKVDEVLNNRISNMAVQLKEKINDIKQLAYFNDMLIKKHLQKPELHQNQQKIVNLSDSLLYQLKQFEEEVTGLKLVDNKK